MSHLEGNVFHVTKQDNWVKIESSGEIKPNINDDLETSFGSSSNSYFKNKGCVSVFDYRKIHEDKHKEFIGKCRPTIPLSEESGIAIIIFKPDIYPKLLLWDNWKTEDGRQMVVPYLEAGHPGPIPLVLVEKAILVTVTEDPNSLAVIMRRGLSNVKEG
ncbi:MAG TPA: hypothetical protein ENI67_04650 [Gammaproteobacteria bacterium]|nr:hypothetical protein [Gammaproteobacteria bacterium]